MMISSTAQCPICASTLQPASHESVAVLRCAHGLFIEPDALRGAVHDRSSDRSIEDEKHAEAGTASASADALVADEGPRACPACSEVMEKRIYAVQSGVRMDVCEHHGIWLDAGELERIEAWYEASERGADAAAQSWVGKLAQIELDHDASAERDVAGLWKFDRAGSFGDPGGRDGTDWWSNGR